MKLKLKKFQLEDLARAAMHDGAILAWEPGLGKSLAAFAWPLAKRASRVLIVAPGGLHRQLAETGLDMFGIHVTALRHPDHARGFRLDRPPLPGAKPRFFVTTYQDLGFNGGDEWLDGETVEGIREPTDQRFRRRCADLRDLVIAAQWAAKLSGKDFDIKAEAAPFFAGVGEVRRGITCVWRPTLARMLSEFSRTGGGFDCVVVDEGTKLQNTESHMSQGVRTLAPRYRLVLTGTPIKNRLESIFWLAWWACGGSARPTARWPYAGTSEAKEAFANQHLQHDRFVDRERDAERKAALRGERKKRRIQRRSARICNIHRLWKLLSPVVLRRRKEECGEDIPGKIVHPIAIAPGTAQLAVYRYHLENPPATNREGKKLKDGRAVKGMQINLLRQAALCPDAEALAESTSTVMGPKRSWTPWTPKLAAILSLVADCLDEGEPVIIGSPFRAFSHTLADRLREAGVTAVLLDGETPADQRGDLAARFKAHEFSVMVAGIAAMAEGHSFEHCGRLILPSLSWAFDENEQFTHRVWRINSPKEVKIYPITMAGSVDMRLAELFMEKGDSAALALDGRLFTDKQEEVNLDALLADAVKAFKKDAATIDEQSIEAKWEKSLKPRLLGSEERFREWHPPIVPATDGTVTSPSEMQSAVEAIEMVPSPTQLAVEIHRARARRKASPAMDLGAALRLARRWRK